MKISRRTFLKYCIGSAAALGLNLSDIGKLEKAFAGNLPSMPTVIWVEGASCSGCSVSLANLIGADSGGPADVADLLINYLNTSFAKTYMSAAGELAVASLREAQKREYVLVVEGGIPTAFDGMTCTVFTDETGKDVTMQEAMLELVPNASLVICAGACSSFGGIPATGSNPLAIKSVSELTGAQTVNIPGCPVHPDWLVGTIASVLCGKIPATDSNGRPTAFYGKTVHSRCPRKPLYDKGSFADNFGQEGRCLRTLGCKGPETYADCPGRGWNNGFNYCTEANANCIGCVEPDFPRPQLVQRS